MPEISLFFGIRVTMYYDDHMPPHFHAEYNGQKGYVSSDYVTDQEPDTTTQATE